MPWMIYGANGYTGRLIAARAKAEGLSPVLAGRQRRAIEEVAREHDCEHRIFDLGSREQLEWGLRGMDAVLHAAGPFSATSAPMVRACLEMKTHYLDISGEHKVLEDCYSLDREAKEKRIVILPAVGADVVPTDCIAKRISIELPNATHLSLAFGGDGHASRGTTRTMLETLSRGAAVRENGELKVVPVGVHRCEIPFPLPDIAGVTVPWGDLASGYRSTGIPNIEVFSAMPRAQMQQLLRGLPLLKTMRWGPAVWLAAKLTAGITGPDEAIRASANGYFWGRVTRGTEHRELSLRTLEPYTLTAHTALASVQRVLRGDVPPGATTPSIAFGHDFIFGFPGTQILS